MDVRYTPHARERMAERDITETQVLDAIKHPDHVQYSQQDSRRILVKKQYYPHEGMRKHLLLIVYEEYTDYILVVTVIDTSKIEKYA